jgi:predicted nucleic acid-binding protein
MPDSFIDSNVLLYVTSGDVLKADRAEQLIRAGGTISVQVLNEIANVTRRKMRYSWGRTNNLLTQFRGLLVVVPVTLDTHRVGISLAERYRLAVYDSMIVAAALDARCDTLWSEDMQDGLVIDRVLTIANPFRADAA